MEWISVKDRLPELETDVLLFDDWKNVDGEQRMDMKVGYLYEFSTQKNFDSIIHRCEWRGHEFIFNITHWMPLPNPPKP